MAMATRWPALRPAGMPRLLLALLVLTVAIPAAFADPTLAEARLARHLVGPERWAQVIRIDNPRRLSGYPAAFHALAFELEDRLWLYVPGTGTQSLSLVAGRNAQDKTNLTEVLRAADPAFQSYTLPKDDDTSAPNQAGDSPAISEGCFIHALAAWRILLARGPAPETAGILIYHGATASRGHAVLYYSVAGKHYVLDEARSAEPIVLPLPPRPDPRTLALTLLETPRTTSDLRAKLLRLHPISRREQTGPARAVET